VAIKKEHRLLPWRCRRRVVSVLSAAFARMVVECGQGSVVLLFKIDERRDGRPRVYLPLHHHNPSINILPP